MNLLLAAEAEGGFHVPSLETLFEFPAFLFEDTLFALNRTGLLYLIAAGIVCALMLTAFRAPKVVPGKFQAAMESVVGFVRDNIVLEVMGPDGLRFVPFLTSLFLFIFVNNFYEIMPFVQFPTTGRMAVPALLALTVWFVFIAVGVKNQGLKYFKNAIVLPGVPFAIHFLLVPIEFISTFIVRPLTLAVRLFANMMAGHILLAIAFIAANAFLIDFHAWPFGFFPEGASGAVIGIFALAAGPLLVAFELLVGVLQAYIFTILTAVYISGALHPDH
ncbi:MAG: F0F1 ATP synthase subunit A [Actinobacteria bacterium]|nr:F0F1 ATP synthase subunit A [Actinomycetota bacterium]